MVKPSELPNHPLLWQSSVLAAGLVLVVGGCINRSSSPGSASVLRIGCHARVFHPPFFIDAFRVYLQGPRIPFESPQWYDRCQGRTRSGRRTPYHRSTGRFLPPFHPLGGSALRVRRFPTPSHLAMLRPLPAIPAFRSRSASRLSDPFQRPRPPFPPGLAALQSRPAVRPRGRWVSCNGRFKLRPFVSCVKGLTESVIHKR